MSNSITILLLVVLFPTLSLALLKLRNKRFSVERRVNRKFRKLNQLKRKSRIIAEQASCYPNSLGADGARKIAEIKTLIGQQEEILLKIEQSIRTGAISHAEDALSDFSLDQTTRKSSLLMAEMSKRIILASENAAKINLPKIRKRQSTITSLKDAGLTDLEPDF